MCGIVGAIGLSTKPEVSHEILSSLLERTQTRGDDATGFWAAALNKVDGQIQNKVFYSKEPKKSSLFVQENEIWKKWNGQNVNLVISHCRKRTSSGIETKNINNHPFLSKNGDIALIHNGNVPEIDMLKSEYGVKSDCDSEVLLKLIESGFYYDQDYLKNTLSELRVDITKKIKDLKEEENVPDWCARMMGLRDLFARVNHGAMAVAVGEIWEDNTRALWLFRNHERPLHVIDLRNELGQIFFVSTPDIFRDVIKETSAKNIIPSDKGIIEFPELGVWLLTCDTENKLQVRKWKIIRKRRFDTSFEKERPSKIKNITNKTQIEIITNLNLETFEELKPAPVITPVNSIIAYNNSNNNEDNEDECCYTIKKNEDILYHCPQPLTPKGLVNYKDQKEAIDAFLNGDPWYLESRVVTINNFAPKTNVSLKYFNSYPTVSVIVPSEKKKLNQEDFPLTDHLYFP